jgi:hypothetical protein
MRREGLIHQHHRHILGNAKSLAMGWGPYKRLLRGVLLGGLTLPKTAWGARGTAFRGQWSLGSLIGSLAILGVLVALVLFLVWPRRGRE